MLSEGSPIAGIDRTLSDFRSWALPDLESPTTRAMLAEYLVRYAMGADGQPTKDWDYVDIRLEGIGDVEVKYSGHLKPPRGTKPTPPRFDIKKRSWAWDADTNDWLKLEPKRRAHVYAFAVHAAREWETFDPADCSQWEFFVVPTVEIDATLGDQKTVGLTTLRKFGEPHRLQGVRKAVLDAIDETKRDCE